MSSLYYGGNSMSSIDEYLNRINQMHRAPTTTMIIGDFPEAPQRNSSHPENHKDHHRVKIFHEVHQQQAPEMHKKVHFTESEERVEVDRRGNKHQVVEDRTIDMEADGFIQKRHKNFESCNNTYKAY